MVGKVNINGRAEIGAMMGWLRKILCEARRPAEERRRRPVRAGRDCCGCGACAQVCPHGAVSMAETEDGFLHAGVDLSLCRSCGICLRTCPVEEFSTDAGPHAVRLFAARSVDPAVRMGSSSGGVFRCLAEHVLARGGVVYGAAWDSATLRVRHVAVDTIEGLARLSGSKYVQSEIGNAYRDVRESLQAGREVLFSGTPCQNEGLRLYIAREYPNLATVDVICHGVASPGVLSRYLRETCPRQAPLDVSFRDKVKGWRNFSLRVSDADSGAVILRETLGENAFLKGFLSNLLLRESCSGCRREWKLRSDITLGDYWNVAEAVPSLADDMGVSAVLVSTRRGAELWEGVSDRVESVETPLAPFFRANRNVLLPSVRHPRRDEFFAAFARGGAGVADLISRLAPWTWLAQKVWKARRHWQKRRIAALARGLEGKGAA